MPKPAQKRLLIATPDTMLGEQLAGRCAQLGAEILQTPTGSATVWALLRTDLDLVIFDLDMPEVDWQAIVKEFGQDERYSHLRLIAVGRGIDAPLSEALASFGGAFCHAGLELWSQLRPLIIDLMGVDVGPGAGVGEITDARAEAEPSPADPPRAPRILIADDDRDVLSALEIRLAAAGYDVVTARNAKEGLQIALLEGPDAIVSDYDMPGLSGEGLVFALKNNAATRDIPVIVMTGFRVDGQPDYALRRDMLGRGGAKAYLEKPFEFEQLLKEFNDLQLIPVKAEDLLPATPDDQPAADKQVLKAG